MSKQKNSSQSERSPGSSEAHNLLIHDILLALGSLSYCRIWRNETGMAYFKNGQPIHYGLVGSSDIIGLTGWDGKFLGIECKTGNAVRSKQQRNFETMIRVMGGRYVVAHSVEEALGFIESEYQKWKN